MTIGEIFVGMIGDDGDDVCCLFSLISIGSSVNCSICDVYRLKSMKREISQVFAFEICVFSSQNMQKTRIVVIYQ